MLRNLGYRQDKIIENEAFWAADKQRMDEQQAREENGKRVFNHKFRCEEIWRQHIEKQKSPERRYYLPGPGAYEINKNFI
jgi:hypothetical protein